MATVIFDFDSTLIELESLEAILAHRVKGQPDLMARLEAITRQGMNGEIAFAESLRRRLDLVAPHREDVLAFGRDRLDLLTDGVARLFAGLRARGVSLKIVSGGLREAILPFARHLGLPDEDVHAVGLLWQADGSFAGIDPNDPFSRSKLAGVTPLAPTWSRPRVVVGDGMTDAHLHREGLAETFIAYTEHVRREAVVATGAPVADSMDRLEHLLEQIL